VGRSVNQLVDKTAPIGSGVQGIACEVRTPAARPVTPAKRIEDLIRGSVKKVEDGAVPLAQSGRTHERPIHLS
jgi:hypothetical protein